MSGLTAGPYAAAPAPKTANIAPIPTPEAVGLMGGLDGSGLSGHVSQIEQGLWFSLDIAELVVHFISGHMIENQ